MTGTAHGPGRVAAVTGIGFTPFSRASGCGVLSLAAEAVANAVEDAGLRLRDVDAMGSFMVSDDSVPCVAVSSTLGMGALRSVLDLQLGGQAPCLLVWQGAQIVARGDAEVVVVYPRSTAARAPGSDQCSSPGRVGSTATRSGTGPT